MRGVTRFFAHAQNDTLSSIRFSLPEGQYAQNDTFSSIRFSLPDGPSRYNELDSMAH